MQFLFVGSGFCLRLPSDSSSRRTPLPSASDSTAKLAGVFTLDSIPCRARQQSPQRSGHSRGESFKGKLLMEFIALAVNQALQNHLKARKEFLSSRKRKNKDAIPGRNLSCSRSIRSEEPEMQGIRECDPAFRADQIGQRRLQAGRIRVPEEAGTDRMTTTPVVRIKRGKSR